MTNGKSISTSELAQQLGNPSFAIIDVRPMAAYNGWRLQGESRGGHIPGAIPCPLLWAEQMEPELFKQFLESKGILAEKSNIIYGYTIEDSLVMLNKLKDLGYENVLLYDAGIAGWTVDEARATDRLPNYHKLVHPDWLNDLITQRKTGASAGLDFEIIHVGCGSTEAYDRGHIPTAIHLDNDSMEAPPVWNRLPDQELQEILPAHGVTHAKTIVLYGQQDESGVGQEPSAGDAGQAGAARAAAILMYAGVRDVRLLDGGLRAWVSAGYELEKIARYPVPAKSFGLQIPDQPQLIVDIEAVKALLTDPGEVLASIRNWQEFTGEDSGYSYLKSKGRIAGAVWGGSGSDGFHPHPLRNFDGSMRDYHVIQANWRYAGITPDKGITFYCGTGWRASEAFFYAHLMGWQRVAIYDGGWLEWSADESNPSERGSPTNSPAR